MYPKRILKLSLALVGILLLGTPTTSYASSQQNRGIRQGLPGRRISGGTRVPSELCLEDTRPLVAVVPESGLSLTAAAEPTLWFYLPAINPSRQLEFSLFEQSGELIYQTQLQVPDSPGLVSVDLTKLSQTPTLKVQENYRWSLAVVCNSQNPSENLWVDGWVQRVEPSPALATESETTPVAAVPQLYLEAGLWHEALSALVASTQSHPEDPAVQRQWTHLLESIHLNQVIGLPPVPVVPTLALHEVAQDE
jgi:hypothetical protein